MLMMMMMMMGFSCANEKPVKPKHTKNGTSFEFKTSESRQETKIRPPGLAS